MYSQYIYIMMNNQIKKDLRDCFNIKNISVARLKEEHYDTNMYYEVLFKRRQKLNKIRRMKLNNKKERVRKN